MMSRDLRFLAESARIVTTFARLGLVEEVVTGQPVLDRAFAWAYDVADNCSPLACQLR